MVKLVKNFRSHNAIIQFPNDKFYHGDLVPCGDPAIINSFLNSPYLPSKKFPVVFHSVSGKDNREASSPSFFNIEEVLQVKYYVQKLKKDRKFITCKFSRLRNISSLTSECFFSFSFPLRSGQGYWDHCAVSRTVCKTEDGAQGCCKGCKNWFRRGVPRAGLSRLLLLNVMFFSININSHITSFFSGT